tara:strand:- start:427 stop:588 length:162 start_codon:yes stop_codon:yes gene_type:complete
MLRPIPPRFELQIIDPIVLMNFGLLVVRQWRTQLGASSTSNLQPLYLSFAADN